MLSMLNFIPTLLMGLPRDNRDRSASLLSDDLPPRGGRTEDDPRPDWQSLIAPALEKLRGMAGTSESAFLRIGEQMQDVYQKSLEISRLANQLVETASGRNLQDLSSRLQLIASEMGSFLARSQSRSRESFSTLQQAKNLLDRLDTPLESVQNMARPLYMLEVLIKVQSSRLGETGNGFVLLAMDIKKLSGQVTDKLDAINTHRTSLFASIGRNLNVIEQLSSVEEEEAKLTLSSTLSSLQELDAANERFTQLGGTIATTVDDISRNIGEVVSSLQFHDINRQKVEHIIEGLEQLSFDLTASQCAERDEAARRNQIIAAGDVCELQEAQLRLASSELYTAVSTIIESLREVANQQTTIQRKATAASGVMDESGNSFVNAVSEGLSTTTALLTTCAGRHHEVLNTMEEMAAAIGASTAFVNEIGGIGDHIVITALNAQIKAGKVGQQGATLAVLAEEIRRLSIGASHNTEAITSTLQQIDKVATGLINETGADESILSTWLLTVEENVHEIMSILGEMQKNLCVLFTTIQGKIDSLAANIAQITAGIEIHEKNRIVTDEVLTVLRQIINHSRNLFPASTDFKAKLQEMNEHYTMESERSIHLAIAGQHGIELEPTDQNIIPAATTGESEFGDNVDLF